MCWPTTGHRVCPEVWLIDTVTQHQRKMNLPLLVGSNCKSLLGERLGPCPLPSLSTGTPFGLNLCKSRTYGRSLCEYSSPVVSGSHRFLVSFIPSGSYSLSAFSFHPQTRNLQQQLSARYTGATVAQILGE